MEDLCSMTQTSAASAAPWGLSMPPAASSALQKVGELMESVSLACDFMLAEALVPREDGQAMMQSGAVWHRTVTARSFYKNSQDLLYPPNIGLPGRCWRLRQVSKHCDVSLLPPSIFLRSEMAQKIGLRGCLAIPVEVKSTGEFFVLQFLAAFPFENDIVVAKAVQAIRRLLQSMADFSVPEPIPEDPSGKSVVKFLQSRSWLKCEIALNKPVQLRTKEDVEDMVKFTRKLEFFKHMPETTREELCKTMQITSEVRGSVVATSLDPPSPMWCILLSGRLAVTSQEQSVAQDVWFFEAGQTFGRSYLQLLSTPAAPAQIRALSSVKFLQVPIPHKLASEFQVFTRPLWYEELAQHFHIGINEAAEIMGLCPSAIKRICRRHGLNRWPHRRIICIERTISNLEGKCRAEQFATSPDYTALDNMRCELLEHVRNKTLWRCNLPLPTGNLPDLEDDKSPDDVIDNNEVGQGRDRPAPMEKGDQKTGLYCIDQGTLLLHSTSNARTQAETMSVSRRGSTVSTEGLPKPVSRRGSIASTDVNSASMRGSQANAVAGAEGIVKPHSRRESLVGAEGMMSAQSRRGSLVSAEGLVNAQAKRTRESFDSASQPAGPFCSVRDEFRQEGVVIKKEEFTRRSSDEEMRGELHRIHSSDSNKDFALFHRAESQGTSSSEFDGSTPASRSPSPSQEMVWGNYSRARKRSCTSATDWNSFYEPQLVDNQNLQIAPSLVLKGAGEAPHYLHVALEQWNLARHMNGEIPVQFQLT